jgi:hypothetical protein
MASERMGNRWVIAVAGADRPRGKWPRLAPDPSENGLVALNRGQQSDYFACYFHTPGLYSG